MGPCGSWNASALTHHRRREYGLPHENNKRIPITIVCLRYFGRMCVCAGERERKKGITTKASAVEKRGIRMIHVCIGFSVSLSLFLSRTLGGGVEKFLMTRLGFLLARAPPNLTLMLFISVGIIRVYIRAAVTTVSCYSRIEYNTH